MPTTIKDIARSLGVSVSTVSYALNNGPRPVKEDLRARVLEAAKVLDYRPNHLARSLITRRSFTVGVVPTEATVSITRSPYFQGCLEGIVNQAESLGQDVLLYTRYDQSQADRFLSVLLDGRADGVLFLAPKDDSQVIELLCGRLPCMVISSHRFQGTLSLTVDNRGGVRKIVEHLANLGHVRIGHLHGRLELEEGTERLRAFRETMHDLGLPVREEWILDGGFTPELGLAAGRKLLAMDSRPTAVFCANDESAMGLMRAALQAGLTLPQDLSIAGFDDSPVAELSFRPLTTIRQPLEALGSTALADLVRLIEGKPVERRSSFQTDLVIRDSTTFPK